MNDPISFIPYVTKIQAAKNAINNLAEFLFKDNPDTESKLSIVQFNKNADTLGINNKVLFGVEDYNNGNISRLINKLSLNNYTNIEAGLEEAGDLLYGYNGIHKRNLTPNNNDVIILLSDGEPNYGATKPSGLSKVVKDEFGNPGQGITNDVYSIAFGSGVSKDTLQAISPNKVYSSSNQTDLFNTFKNIVYEAGDPVEVEINSTSQTIYTGEQELADDQKITITYDGLATPKEYTFTKPGTSSDGILTYQGNSDGTYSLVFNYTNELLGKENITITYYVK